MELVLLRFLHLVTFSNRKIESKRTPTKAESQRVRSDTLPLDGFFLGEINDPLRQFWHML